MNRPSFDDVLGFIMLVALIMFFLAAPLFIY